MLNTTLFVWIGSYHIYYGHVSYITEIEDFPESFDKTFLHFGIGLTSGKILNIFSDQLSEKNRQIQHDELQRERENFVRAVEQLRITNNHR
jgi:hypothetical protein